MTDSNREWHVRYDEQYRRVRELDMGPDTGVASLLSMLVDEIGYLHALVAELRKKADG